MKKCEVLIRFASNKTVTLLRGEDVVCYRFFNAVLSSFEKTWQHSEGDGKVARLEVLDCGDGKPVEFSVWFE